MSQKQRGARKRKKNYYGAGGSKKTKLAALDADMRGFLITCNRNEGLATRDAYAVLNEYADALYGPVTKPSGNGSEDEDPENSFDLEKELEKEITAIKETKPSQYRFQAIDSGANNVLFVKTTLDDPYELGYHIVRDIFNTQTSKCRYILRFLPILGTCKAHLDRIEKLAKNVLGPFFKTTEGLSYSVMIKVRNNNAIGRYQVFPMMGRILSTFNPEHRVDLEKPEYVISVDILRTVCCIGIAKDFYKFRKYNLQELVSGQEGECSGRSGGKQEVSEEQGDVDGQDSGECGEQPAVDSDQTQDANAENGDPPTKSEESNDLSLFECFE